MFVAVFLLLLFNTMVQAQYDGYNNFDPFRPDFNPIPPNLFQVMYVAYGCADSIGCAF
ncbi:hypothetical protein OSTOST_05308 [Ostertagia ostertagi]